MELSDDALVKRRITQQALGGVSRSTVIRLEDQGILEKVKTKSSLSRRDDVSPMGKRARNRRRKSRYPKKRSAARRSNVAEAS